MFGGMELVELVQVDGVGLMGYVTKLKVILKFGYDIGLHYELVQQMLYG